MPPCAACIYGWEVTPWGSIAGAFHHAAERTAKPEGCVLREVLGRGPGPPLAAADDGVRLQSRVQLLDGQLGQYLIGAHLSPHRPQRCACEK